MDHSDAWAMVAVVVDGVEAELDVFVRSIADRVAARIQARYGRPSVRLQDALRRGVQATVCDVVARLRSRAEPPQELPSDVVELARLCAGSHCEGPDLADAWLVGQEAFWDRFQVITERALDDTTLCWQVMKAVRAQLRDHAARASELFRAACERERACSDNRDSRLAAVLRALDGYWVDRGELRYDLAHEHIAVVADDSRSLDTLKRQAERELLVVEAPAGGGVGMAGRTDPDR